MYAQASGKEWEERVRVESQRGGTGGPRRIIAAGEKYNLILKVQSIVSLWPMFGD